MSNSTSLVRTASHGEQNKSVATAYKSNLQLSKAPPSTVVSSPLPKLQATPQKPATPSAAPAKSTPRQQTTVKTLVSQSPNPSSPGKWQHPRLDEVVRRQEKTKFDLDNVAVITRNAVALVISFAVPSAIGEYVMKWPRLGAIESRFSWSLWAFLYAIFWLGRALLLANVGTALSPLVRSADPCEDIPLDPSQRKLLGLPPMSRPATPLEKSQWVTPPRFSRNNTPHSATSSLHVHASDSPNVFQHGTPLNGLGQLSGSPYSPSVLGPGTPQFQGGDVRRRLSYTSTRSSPLNMSEFEMAGNVGTPTKNNRASIGLNNKWLYEKGWASPRSSPRPSGNNLLS